MMEQVKRNELPESCFSTLDSTGGLILIKRGEEGYYPFSWETGDRAKNQEIADFQNGKAGITPAQIKAMEVGSAFGFHVPGANPQLYYDEAKLIDFSYTIGTIKDPETSMFTLAEGILYKYEVAGKQAVYLDLSAMPEGMLSRWSHSIILPDLIGGKPLVPVSAEWAWDERAGENRCAMTLEPGCCIHGCEINAGLQLIAKVDVGPVEYALAQLPSAKYDSFATWERTPKNDESGKPNYYWGHYHNNRQKAIEDFCARASEKYEMLTEQRQKPSIRTQLAAVESEQRDKPTSKAKGREEVR